MDAKMLSSPQSTHSPQPHLKTLIDLDEGIYAKLI